MPYDQRMAVVLQQQLEQLFSLMVNSRAHNCKKGHLLCRDMQCRVGAVILPLKSVLVDAQIQRVEAPVSWNVLAFQVIWSLYAGKPYLWGLAHGGLSCRNPQRLPGSGGAGAPASKSGCQSVVAKGS